MRLGIESRGRGRGGGREGAILVVCPVFVVDNHTDFILSSVHQKKLL